LHAYERFLVKEGVGAGGSALAALLATGCSIAELQVAIDAAYDSVFALA
jgi:NaMN:DMB phosphoribosyltransferase